MSMVWMLQRWLTGRKPTCSNVTGRWLKWDRFRMLREIFSRILRFLKRQVQAARFSSMSFQDCQDRAGKRVCFIPSSLFTWLNSIIRLASWFKSVRERTKYWILAISGPEEGKKDQSIWTGEWANEAGWIRSESCLSIEWAVWLSNRESSFWRIDSRSFGQLEARAKLQKRKREVEVESTKQSSF